MASTDRREFLKKSANLAGSGALALSAASYGRILGANEKLNLALIGSGDRGNHDMGEFQLHPEVRVSAICDIYDAHIARGKAKAPEAQSFTDHRKVLESKDVDAVLIATPVKTYTSKNR
jgi:NADH/NAD ratio-sensing transcriptional regulator Rex